MTTSNHILAGSLIAMTFSSPLIVIPLALLSHFFLDALPHFGNTNPELSAKEKFRKYLSVEILGAVGIILLAVTGKYGMNLMTLAAFVAVLPDLEWPIRYFYYARKGKDLPNSITAKLHKRIQKHEREQFIIVEIAFFVVGFILFQSIQ